jgi:hypothetical protein
LSIRKKLKLSSDDGDSGGEKFKRGYDAAYVWVWRCLHLVGVWIQAVSFVLVLSVKILLQSL